MPSFAFTLFAYCFCNCCFYKFYFAVFVLCFFASVAPLPYFFALKVIWLNENTEDFALYGELEEAFFRNHRKLDVSCIVERDLFGHQLAANANVQEAAPDFKIGTLAAVAGGRTWGM